MNLKANELEKDSFNGKFFEEKSKEKDSKIRDLVKKVEKVMQINKGLEL